MPFSAAFVGVGSGSEDSRTTPLGSRRLRFSRSVPGVRPCLVFPVPASPVDLGLVLLDERNFEVDAVIACHWTDSAWTSLSLLSSNHRQREGVNLNQEARRGSLPRRPIFTIVWLGHSDLLCKRSLGGTMKSSRIMHCQVLGVPGPRGQTDLEFFPRGPRGQTDLRCSGSERFRICSKRLRVKKLCFRFTVGLTLAKLRAWLDPWVLGVRPI